MIRYSREIRFTVFAALLFLIPFFITVFQFRRNNENFHKMYTSGYMEMRTQSAARLVSDVLAANYNILEIVNSQNLGKQDRESIAALRKKLPSSCYDIAILDQNGRERYRISSGNNAEYDYSASEAVRIAVSSGVAAGNVEYSRYMPPVFVSAVPLPDKSGFAAGRFSLAYIGSIVRRIAKNSYGSMGIVDSGGQVISDSLNVSAARPGMLAPEQLLNALAYARVENMSSIVQEANDEKRDYLISISNIEGTDWWFYEVLDTRFMPLAKEGMKITYTAISGTLMMIICAFATCLIAKGIFQKE